MRRRVLAVETLLVVVALSSSLVATSNILDLIYGNGNAGTNLEKQQKENSAEGSSSSINISETIDAGTTTAVDNEQPATEDKTCNCDGLVCMCCVDFNVTFIDLGGPGCVKMKYISQDEGVLLNVSYGDNLLRSAIAHGSEPAPTCVSLLAHFAEVCARFTSLTPHNDGLRGCLKLEPKLLGDIQTQFNIGCFAMGPDGMQLDDQPEEITTTISTTSDTNQNHTTAAASIDNLNEEDILAVVNESAQKGLAFFQNWLGIDFGSSNNAANATAHQEQGDDTKDETQDDTNAAAKHIETQKVNATVST